MVYDSNCNQRAPRPPAGKRSIGFPAQRPGKEQTGTIRSPSKPLFASFLATTGAHPSAAHPLSPFRAVGGSGVRGELGEANGPGLFPYLSNYVRLKGCAPLRNLGRFARCAPVVATRLEERKFFCRKNRGPPHLQEASFDELCDFGAKFIIKFRHAKFLGGLQAHL